MCNEICDAKECLLNGNQERNFKELCTNSLSTLGAAIEFSERLSYFGIATNLISYLTNVLHQDLKTAKLLDRSHHNNASSRRVLSRCLLGPVHNGSAVIPHLSHGSEPLDNV
ncbi:hypothetical protein CRYUN_Cryun05aG0155700 [Craigia yunnanensis]